MQPPRSIRAQLVVDRDHYDHLVQKAIAGANVSVWIATANVKEMMVEAPVGTRARARGRFMSILDMMESLCQRGADLRLLHSGLPSRAFRSELALHPRLLKGGLVMKRCPRVHLKLVAVDGKTLYLGSANFTGAGLGAKGEGRRNFELGLVTDDDVMLDTAQARFDAIWSGKECRGCKVRGLCPKPLDAPVKTARFAAKVGKKSRLVTAPPTPQTSPPPRSVRPSR